MPIRALRALRTASLSMLIACGGGEADPTPSAPDDSSTTTSARVESLEQQAADFCAAASTCETAEGQATDVCLQQRSASVALAAQLGCLDELESLFTCDRAEAVCDDGGLFHSSGRCASEYTQLRACALESADPTIGIEMVALLRCERAARCNAAKQVELLDQVACVDDNVEWYQEASASSCLSSYVKMESCFDQASPTCSSGGVTYDRDTCEDELWAYLGCT